MPSRDDELLRDMLDYAQRVQYFICGKNREDLLKDQEMLGLAVVRAIEIIGEAGNQVSDELQQAHPQIPWRKIIGMRHRLIHNYGHVNYVLVWEVATVNIPELITELMKLIDDEGNL